MSLLIEDSCFQSTWSGVAFLREYNKLPPFIPMATCRVFSQDHNLNLTDMSRNYRGFIPNSNTAFE